MLCYGFVNVNIQAYYTWSVPLSSCQVVYTFHFTFLFAFKAKYCTRPTYCLINSIVNTVCVLTIPLPFSLHVYYQFYFFFIVTAEICYSFFNLFIKEKIQTYKGMCL